MSSAITNIVLASGNKIFYVGCCGVPIDERFERLVVNLEHRNNGAFGELEGLRRALFE